MTLPEFQRVFPDDAACARYLAHLRWPHGLTCMKCGKIGEPYRFAKRRSVVLRCRACQANVSLMAGTVMRGSPTPLSVWFWGAYLVATQTPGQSALQFQRQLGMSRYETAVQMLHTLRAGMVRPERDAIGSQYPVEVDETFVGGRTKGEGYGVHHKATVVGAIEVRPRQTAEESRLRGQMATAPCAKPRRQDSHGVRARQCGKGRCCAHRWLAQRRRSDQVGLLARARGD